MEVHHHLRTFRSDHVVKGAFVCLSGPSMHACMHASHTYTQRERQAPCLPKCMQLLRSSDLGCWEERQDTSQGSCSRGSVSLCIAQHQLLVCAYLQVCGGQARAQLTTCSLTICSAATCSCSQYQLQVVNPTDFPVTNILQKRVCSSGKYETQLPAHL